MSSRNEKIVISLDCMGGDNAPRAILEGASIIAKQTNKVHFLLFGRKQELDRAISRFPSIRSVSEIRYCKSIISADDKPTIALRKGRDSSMRMAIEAVKDGEADAIISAGNTGALMAMSKIVLRTLSSIDRPALIQLMPNQKGSATALLDMGANIECDSLNLCQFAVMGSAFYSSIMKISHPSVGILNIGSEDMKGNDAVKNASNMLKGSEFKRSFRGFVEGNDILKGVVEVVVTDGFSGNIALKAIEGASRFVYGAIKDSFKASVFAKMGYLLTRGALNKTRKKLDPRLYNGAMFVGLNGISVKSHGNADGFAFSNAIKNTMALVENNINEKIINLIEASEFDNNLS